MSKQLQLQPYFLKVSVQCFYALCVAVSCTLAATLVHAQGLPKPEHSVLLTVTGKITQTNAEGRAEFDRAMLEALPQYQFTTASPWVEGSHSYQGVLLSELLKVVGATGDRLIARALNDYHAQLDMDLLADYPAILAMRVDGRAMRIRDKGPLWILLPMSDYPELNTPEAQAQMVWQLKSLEVN